MTLARERCVACRRDSPRVTEEEIAELHPLVPDWELTDNDGIPRVERSFRFRNFAQALAFTQRVGAEAEAEGHHPRLTLEWGPRRRPVVDPQDPRPPPQRLHHGRQDRPPLRPNRLTRL